MTIFGRICSEIHRFVPAPFQSAGVSCRESKFSLIRTDLFEGKWLVVIAVFRAQLHENY